jgi:hypothetical protein
LAEDFVVTGKLLASIIELNFLEIMPASRNSVKSDGLSLALDSLKAFEEFLA